MKDDAEEQVDLLISFLFIWRTLKDDAEEQVDLLINFLFFEGHWSEQQVSECASIEASKQASQASIEASNKPASKHAAPKALRISMELFFIDAINLCFSMLRPKSSVSWSCCVTICDCRVCEMQVDVYCLADESHDKLMCDSLK